MTRSVKLECDAMYKQIAAAILEETDWSASVDPIAWHLAKANNLLLALWRAQDNKHLLNETWRKQVSILTQLETETADAVCNIIPRFSESGLPLLAIKSFLPFPYADSNLDLVTVKPDQLGEYVRLLQSLGYKRFRNLADVREPMKQTYQTSNVSLRLHLHTAISWNGVVYLPLEQVWQRRRKWETEGGPVWIPSPEDELLIMAAHALFENKLVSLHEVLYWCKLTETDLDWTYVTETAENHGWHHGLIQFAAIINQLAGLIDISVELPLSLPSVPLSLRVWLPYIFPVTQNWHVTGHILAGDLRQGKLREIPRLLFSYLLVDHFWMYRKAYRKRRKVMAICS